MINLYDCRTFALDDITLINPLPLLRLKEPDLFSKIILKNFKVQHTFWDNNTSSDTLAFSQNLINSIPVNTNTLHPRNVKSAQMVFIKKNRCALV